MLAPRGFIAEPEREKAKKKTKSTQKSMLSHLVVLPSTHEHCLLFLQLLTVPVIHFGSFFPREILQLRLCFGRNNQNKGALFIQSNTGENKDGGNRCMLVF